jgi:cold shock CspA family protein
VQGVVQSYDPAAGTGVVLGEPDRSPILLRPGSLDGSVFRQLHPGQRIVFDVVDVDGRPCAARVRIGSDGY